MKKKILVLIFLLCPLILKPSALVNSETSRSQEYRLDQIEKLSATASSKIATNSATPKANLISFSEGTVISIVKNIIYLDASAGTQTIYTSENTTYYNFNSAGKKLIGIIDLKSGDSIDVIGLSPQASSGSAKIVVRDQTSSIKNFALFGQVSEITSSILKINNFTRTDLPIIKMVINSETTTSNGRKQNLKLTEISVNNLVVVAGYFDGKNNLVAKQIFRAFLTADTLNATSSAK